jgi:hypothetical protein
MGLLGQRAQGLFFEKPYFLALSMKGHIMLGVNKLPSTKRAEILGMMVEGVTIRAITRLTGVSKNTIVKLPEDAGEAFSDYQDKNPSRTNLQAGSGR